MATIDAGTERRATLAAGRDQVWDVIADVEHLGALVPKVVDYRRVDDGWRWVLEGHTPVGTVRPSFTAQYVFEAPHRLTFDSVEATPTGGTAAQGAFELQAADEGTVVTVRFRIHVAVPVPSLMAGAARRFVVDELTELADGFLGRLGDAVAG